MVKKKRKKGYEKNFFGLFLLFFKGLLMGFFDLIPGISGGTVALITNIYEKLIFEISNAYSFLKELFSFNKKKISKSWDSLDKTFLSFLILGLIAGIILIVHVMSFLLEKFFVQTIGFIAGIILLAGIVLVKKNVSSFRNLFIGLIGLFLGIVLSYLSHVHSSSGQDFNLLNVFFMGLIVIIAMILPGISGALILYLLGAYDFMLFALKNIVVEYLVVIVFILGALVGLGLFSKIVDYLLKKHYVATMSFFSFLMLGAVLKPVLEIVDSSNSLHAIPFFLLAIIVGFIFWKN